MNKKAGYSKNIINDIIFIVLLLGISYYYNYLEIINLRPQSIHYFRQTDCASVALNYYQNGMHFFEPEIMNLHADDDTSGYSVGEFPGIYYVVAVLYKIFGFNEAFFRGVNLLIFYLGLFALFKLLKGFLKDNFWSIAISLLFFVSPIIAYYANNFIPDTSALAFTFIGWYYFFRFNNLKKYKHLNLAMLFFLFASVLKITAAISVIVLMMIYLIEKFNLYKFGKAEKSFSRKIKHVIPLILTFLLIIAWYSFAIYYKRAHDSWYFSTRIWPLWELTYEKINIIIHAVSTRWVYEYFHISVLIFFLICFILILIFNKRTKSFLTFISVMIFIGLIGFSVLWFYAFENHDYYLISLFVLPLFILITFFDMLRKHLPVIFKSIIIKIIFTAWLVFNMYYSERIVYERYNGWQSEYPVFKDIHTITPYLRSIGIERSDKVISPCDFSGNYTLYLMNQRGWTNILRLSGDSAKIAGHINKGAKYLILVGEEMLEADYLQPFMKNKYGEYNSITIYDLQH